MPLMELCLGLADAPGSSPLQPSEKLHRCPRCKEVSRGAGAELQPQGADVRAAGQHRAKGFQRCAQLGSTGTTLGRALGCALGQPL